MLPATKQQIPLPSYNHPKAILSHEISLPTKSFTTTPSPRPQPLPFTHHRNHHAQQLIFCVSSSFILIHLKALLLATRQKIPLPPATTQKAILPHRISLPTKSFTTTPRNFSHCPSYPPSKPPCTTIHFSRFNFVHPDTPKNITPRDQAKNPSTLLRPPKKPPCPTELHFPQRASLPPFPATSTIALRTLHRNHHAQQFIFRVSTSFTLIHLKTLLHATKQQIPPPSCDHPKSHPAPQRASLPPRPRNFSHCPSYPPSKPPRTTIHFSRFNFIHPDTPESIAPRDQATNPSTLLRPPKSHPVPRNFTSHKELHYHPFPPQLQPLPFTHHRNHHAQQLIFCVSTSFTLIHLKALLLATKQQIPLPYCDHPKSHPVPRNFTSHKELHYHLPRNFSHCPSYPPSKPPRTTIHFSRFDFIHPDTSKSIAPRDQATNPSTLLRPPKKPPCPTELHFPQRASLPPRPSRNFNHCPSHHHRNHHAANLRPGTQLTNSTQNHRAPHFQTNQAISVP